MLPTTSFAALLYLASAAIAQNLAFLQPRFDTLDTSNNGLPELTVGENVTVGWESSYEYTTLVVYQEVASYLFQEAVLAQRYGRDRTSVTWQVGALLGSPGIGGAFHFELRNGLDADCNGCSMNSDNFVVSRRRAASSTSSSSRITSSSTAATSASAHNTPSSTSHTSTASPTLAVAGAHSTNTPSPQTSTSSDNAMGVGLGVGLGLGIPLLLGVVALLFFVRRRKYRRNGTPRGRQPSPSNSPDRASGALLDPEGRQSQQEMLYRPSTAARSEMSSWSHRSWIEPFDFEQVETRDQDAMSQLRQSIYSNSRSRRSQVSLSNPASEWGMLEGIPEQPQAVHDGRWSRTL